MAIEVGEILEGKISGITNFGVFVDLADSKAAGLVHISEVSHTYVSELKDFVKIGQEVKVKVTAITENGKIALSMKQAMPKEKSERPKRRFEKREYVPAPPVTSPGDYEWRNAGKNIDSSTFEDMMSKFKKTSEDKMSDLKRSGDSKGYSRRSRR